MYYKQFVRYKPFFVTEVRSNDRNTCACYQNENIWLLVDSFLQRGLLSTKSLSSLLSSISCNTEDMKCMNRTCAKCCLDVVQLAGFNANERAKWEHWQKEEVVVANIKHTNLIEKTETGTIRQLVEEFSHALEAIAIHHFNLLHQA